MCVILSDRGKKQIIMIHQHLKEKWVIVFLPLCKSAGLCIYSSHPFSRGGDKEASANEKLKECRKKTKWNSVFNIAKRRGAIKTGEVEKSREDGMVGSTQGNNGSTGKTEGWGGAEEYWDANRIRRKPHSRRRKEKALWCFTSQICVNSLFVCFFIFLGTSPQKMS